MKFIICVFRETGGVVQSKERGQEDKLESMNQEENSSKLRTLIL